MIGREFPSRLGAVRTRLLAQLSAYTGLKVSYEVPAESVALSLQLVEHGLERVQGVLKYQRFVVTVRARQSGSNRNKANWTQLVALAADAQAAVEGCAGNVAGLVSVFESRGPWPVVVEGGLEARAFQVDFLVLGTS